MRAVIMADLPIERFYKSSWHLAIGIVGLYEFRTKRQTRLSKILALGLIAFHLDAAVCDALDIPTTPQRLFRNLVIRP
jgi:hypothetical protein